MQGNEKVIGKSIACNHIPVFCCTPEYEGGISGYTWFGGGASAWPPLVFSILWLFLCIYGKILYSIYGTNKPIINNMK